MPVQIIPRLSHSSCCIKVIDTSCYGHRLPTDTWGWQLLWVIIMESQINERLSCTEVSYIKHSLFSDIGLRIKKLKIRWNSSQCILQLASFVRFGVSSSRVICSPPWQQGSQGGPPPGRLFRAFASALLRTHGPQVGGMCSQQSSVPLGNVKDTSILWTLHSNINMYFSCLLLL